LDRLAVLAITDHECLSILLGELFSVAGGGDEAIDELTLGAYRQMPPGDLWEAWRTNRESLAAASAGLTNDQRVSWYGPSMSSRSFLTARLKEPWAHGQDIADTVGVVRPATDRLQHIAQLGFITRAWSYTNRCLQVPSEPVRVDLLSPSGERWFYGPEGAGESVEGAAEDFCFVVTQRRHVDDTTLTMTAIGRD
jgi:uncharacterized protein (TIGR03084 family)